MIKARWNTWVFYYALAAVFVVSNSAPTRAQPARAREGALPAIASSEVPREARDWSLPLAEGMSVELIWVPAGTFLMGSPESDALSKPDERPQTQVTLSKGFWIGKTIFTIGQWKGATGDDVRSQLIKVINDETLYDLGGRQRMIRDFMRFSKEADPGQYLAGEGMELPMYFVSWDNAMAVCKSLTDRERARGRLPAGYEYNLPTEAQFEYACRAGTTEATYVGPVVVEGRASPTIDAIAWYSGNSTEGYSGKGFNVAGRTGGPHPVGQKKPNAWGLYDMTGNIWQWCRDAYGPLPGGSVTDPFNSQSTSDKVNSQSISDKVNRGGSFGSAIAAERSANRAKNPQAEASAYRGFRLALCPAASP